MEEKQGILRRIGPGVITAALVVGPGSIVASSRAGAEGEYRLVWLLTLACLFMATFTAMGARLGCALTTTPLRYLAERWGRPLAFITGLSAFLVTAGFQFGNNIGVGVALGQITGTPLWLWPIVFTILALAFLFWAKHVYRLLERVMIGLVAVMLIAFVVNLFWTGFRPLGIVQGLVPKTFQGSDNIIARALLGTTFSAVAAFYQAYLVRAKGWGRENVRNAIGDAWLGIALLGTIALVILIGAAGALYGEGRDFGNVGELAKQLRGVLGGWATLVFCLGLAAASFSSFIANALIGGTMMADGVGQDPAVGSKPVKAWTAVVMLIGCTVAVMTILLQRGNTTSLLVAQAATLIAAPLCAVLLYGLTSSKTIMGDLKNRWPTMVLGLAGLGIMLWLNVGLFVKLVNRLLGA